MPVSVSIGPAEEASALASDSVPTSEVLAAAKVPDESAGLVAVAEVLAAAEAPAESAGPAAIAIAAETGLAVEMRLEVEWRSVAVVGVLMRPAPSQLVLGCEMALHPWLWRQGPCPSRGLTYWQWPSP